MAATSRVSYGDEECILLESGSFTAKVLPGVGGNCISFDDSGLDHHYLRTPGEGELSRFREAPARWGIPFLCPPNRTADGVFRVGERSYRFPINEPENHNQLHGPFLRLPWAVEDRGTDGDAAYVLLGQSIEKSHPAFAMIPHRHHITMRYVLSPRRLAQEVTVENRSDSPLPFMLGFHTVLRVPFAPGSSPEDYRVRVPIAKRWERGGRMLPTGRLLDLSPIEQELRSDGVPPQGVRWGDYYSGDPGDHRVTLVDARARTRLAYEVGPWFRHWVVWNDDAASGFFCAEPQTCTVNAPNLDIPHEDSGLFFVGPGQSWSDRCTLAPEPVSGVQ